MKNGACSCNSGPFDSAAKNCGVCAIGQTWNKAAQTCKTCTDSLCVKCDLASGDKCQQCATGYTINNKTNLCSCNGGYIRSNDSFCITCKPRQYFDGRSCLGCQEQYCADCSLSTVGVCNACLPSFVLGADNKCRCPDNTILNKATNICVPLKGCPTGFYNPGSNQCFKCA